MNIPTNEEVSKPIVAILKAAKAINERINCVCVNMNDNSTEPYVAIYGIGIRDFSGYGVEQTMAKITPFNPLAEKMAEIAKLESEIAAIKQQIESKENEISQPTTA